MLKMAKHPSRGISLMELMIVVVVTGIIAAMAVPDFLRVMEKLKLNAATRDVMSDLRWARSRSISSRTQVGVNFNFGTKSYSVFFDKDNPSGFVFDAAKDSVVKSGSLSSLGTCSSTLTSNTVIFKPDGTSNNSGTITYTSQDGYHTHVVDVLASTGRIKITT